MQDVLSEHSGLPQSPMSIEDKFVYKKLLGLEPTPKGAKKDQWLLRHAQPYIKIFKNSYDEEISSNYELL